MSNELSFIWDDALIPLEMQARLSQMGFFDIDTWALVEDTVPGVRGVLIQETGFVK